MLRTLLAVVVLTLALGACGGAEPTPGEVVEGWVEALTLGSDEEAAAFFADKPILVQGFLPNIPQSRAGIVRWHSRLDCGGEITGMRVVDQQVTATFALADRVQFRCPAPGYLSTVIFNIRDGLIKTWEQTLPGTIVEDG